MATQLSRPALDAQASQVKRRGRSRFGLALAIALLSVQAPAEPLVSRNLPTLLPAYSGMPLYENSADVLLQVPAMVDRLAPIPIRIRVLQEGVEWISLLSDTPDPALLARFSLEAGTLPELSIRVFDNSLEGILAVATTASRYLAARRTFQRPEPEPEPESEPEQEPAPEAWVPAADTGTDTAIALDDFVIDTLGDIEFPGPAPAAGPPPLLDDKLKLSAALVGETTVVRLSSGSLLQQLGGAEADAERWISELELMYGERRVLSGELSSAVWHQPFFQFAFAGGKAGDQLALRWLGSDGSRGQLTAEIAPQ